MDMDPTLVILLVVLGVVLLIGLMLVGIVVGIYNKLVKFRERGNNAFAQIDVQLTRRHDLIPNLVETAKGYMAHEKETLTAVIEARAKATQAQINVQGSAMDAGKMAKLAGAEGALGGALGRLMMTMERYPDLKANEQMGQLTEELTTTENKISFARQAFNDAVNAYNAYKKTFPPVVLAGAFKFTDAAYFEIEDEQIREAPAVSF